MLKRTGAFPPTRPPLRNARPKGRKDDTFCRSRVHLGNWLLRIGQYGGCRNTGVNSDSSGLVRDRRSITVASAVTPTPSAAMKSAVSPSVAATAGRKVGIPATTRGFAHDCSVHWEPRNNPCLTNKASPAAFQYCGLSTLKRLKFSTSQGAELPKYSRSILFLGSGPPNGCGGHRPDGSVRDVGLSPAYAYRLISVALLARLTNAQPFPIGSRVSHLPIGGL